MPDDNIAVPCGLVAKSYFNDTFKIFNNEDLSKEIKINDDNIAWTSDIESKFHNIA